MTEQPALIDRALSLCDARDGDTFCLQLEHWASADGEHQADARLILAYMAEFPDFRANLLAAVRQRRP